MVLGGGACKVPHFLFADGARTFLQSAVCASDSSSNVEWKVGFVVVEARSFIDNSLVQVLEAAGNSSVRPAVQLFY